MAESTVRALRVSQETVLQAATAKPSAASPAARLMPRPLVLVGVVAFCLAVWAVAIAGAVAGISWVNLALTSAT